MQVEPTHFLRAEHSLFVSNLKIHSRPDHNATAQEADKSRNHTRLSKSLKPQRAKVAQKPPKILV
jgi:hypothetical protein